MAEKELVVKISADVRNLKKDMEKASKSISKSLEDATNYGEKSFEDLVKKADKSAGKIEKEFKNVNFNFDKKTKEAVKELKDLQKKSEKESNKIVKVFSGAGKEIKTAFTKVGTGAKKAFQGLSKDAKKHADKTENAFDGMTNAVKGKIGALASAITGAFAISGISSFIDEMAQFAKDTGKLEGAFENAKLKAEDAQKVYKDFYAILRDEGTATEASQLLVNMTNDTKKMAQWTNIATGIFGTFGDSLPIEGLIESANETARVGKVTGTLADALNWVGISEDKFNEKLEKTKTFSERERMIRELLNKEYKESAENYKDNNKELMAYNEAQAEHQQKMKEIGETLMPIKTEITKFVDEFLGKIDFSIFVKKWEEVKEKLGEIDWEKIKNGIKNAYEYLKEIGGYIDETLSTAMDTLKTNFEDLWDAVNGDEALKATLTFIKDTFKWLKDHGTEVGDALFYIANAFIFFKSAVAIGTVIGWISKLATWIGGAWASIKATGFLTWLTGLSGFWTGLVVAIGLAVVAIWKNWDKICEFFRGLSEDLTKAHENVKEAWGKLWDMMKEKYETKKKEVNESIKKWLSDFWNDIIKAKDNVVRSWNELWQMMKDKYEAKKKEVNESIKNFFKGIWDKVITAKNNVVRSWNELWNMMKEKYETKKEEVNNSIKNFFQGIVNKAIEMKNSVVSALKEMVNNAFINPFNSAVKGVRKGVNKIISCVNGISQSIAGTDIITMSPLNETENVITPLAKGTNHFKGGTALVGEAGRELVSDPRLGTFMANQPTLLNLSKGASVLRNSKTEALLRGMGLPAFASGKNEGFFSGAFNKVKQMGSKVWGYISDPKSLLLDIIGNPFGGLGFLAPLAIGLKDKIIDGIKDFVGEFLESNKPKTSLGGGGANWVEKIVQAASFFGDTLSQTDIDRIVQQINTESGGNAKAVQSASVNDINMKNNNPAKGLLQYIPQTFNAYALKGFGDIFNGYHQLLAFFNNSTWRSALPQLGEIRGWSPRGARRYGNGGIVTGSTYAHMGEKGSEAIVPLSNAHALKPFGEAVKNSILEQNKKATIQPSENAVYEFTIPVIIDGRQVAQATAVFTKEELDKMEKKQNRRNGKR